MDTKYLKIVGLLCFKEVKLQLIQIRVDFIENNKASSAKDIETLNPIKKNSVS